MSSKNRKINVVQLVHTSLHPRRKQDQCLLILQGDYREFTELNTEYIKLYSLESSSLYIALLALSHVAPEPAVRNSFLINQDESRNARDVHAL